MQQAPMAMLAQGNQMPQMVLQLLKASLVAASALIGFMMDGSQVFSFWAVAFGNRLS